MEEMLGAHRRASCARCSAAAPPPSSPRWARWAGRARLVINNGKPGEVAARLYDTITGVQYGTQPDKHGWMTTLEG